MKKLLDIPKALIGAFALFVSLNASAQQFTPKELPGAESLQKGQIAWGDFSKNDSLEVLVTGINSAGDFNAYIIKNAWIKNPEVLPININVLVQGGIAVSDIDHDGIPDVLISGKNDAGIPQSFILSANNNLEFVEKPIALSGFYQGSNIIADFNNDGKKDLFLNGKNEQDVPQSILYRNAENSFTPEDTGITGLTNGAALVLDFNKDGFADLFLTGIDETGNKRSILYENEGKFKFKVTQELEGLSEGAGAVGDFNGDGFMDILITGQDNQNMSNSILYLGSGKEIKNSGLQMKGVINSKAFLVDLNHDGNTDILISGEVSDGAYQTILYYGDKQGIFSQEIISEGKEIYFSLGDSDRDGNPDLMEFQIDDNADFKVTYYQNTTQESNFGPSPPTNPIVLPMRNKAYFSWSPATDDVTPSQALTYDIIVTQNQTQIIKNPDTGTAGYRTTVAHGSQFQDTTWAIYGLKEGEYDWGIMAVDNAFRGDGQGEGICVGGTFRICSEIASSDTTLCEKGLVEFNMGNDGPKHVYSSREGYKGIHSGFSYDVQKADTLYFISIDPTICSSSLELIINVPEEEKKFSLGDDRSVCSGEEISLTLPVGLQETKWLVNGEEQGNEQGFTAVITERVQIIAMGKYPGGCSIGDTLIVDIAPKPEIEISHNATIAYGGSVNLFASGGESYHWSPATGLNDPGIPNPTASPESTTTYTVTVTNAEGCEDQKSVNVSVQNNLFIPNLFTPNGDGNNEAFKLYGSNIGKIVLQVFDRSGNLVYEGQDQEAFTRGWDGSKNGKAQPAGAYVWRLKGSYNDGSLITYQGKTSGTINLVR